MTKNICTEETGEQINLLFWEFFCLFPSTHNVFPSLDNLRHAKISWTKSLIISGIINEEGILNMDKFNAGKKGLCFLDQQFMPSCGQFINLCLNKTD